MDIPLPSGQKICALVKAACMDQPLLQVQKWLGPGVCRPTTERIATNKLNEAERGDQASPCEVFLDGRTRSDGIERWQAHGTPKRESGGLASTIIPARWQNV